MISHLNLIIFDIPKRGIVNTYLLYRCQVDSRMEDTHYKSLLSILTCNLCKITQYSGQAAKIPTDFQKETCGRSSVYVYTEEKAFYPLLLNQEIYLLSFNSIFFFKTTQPGFSQWNFEELDCFMYIQWTIGLYNCVGFRQHYDKM